MTPLSTRAQQAKPEETRWLLEELRRVTPYPAGVVGKAMAGYDRTFYALLDCEAFVDAAVMLVPEGFSWSVIDRRTDPHCNPCAQLWTAKPASTKQGDAATPALALIAAIAKAQESGQ